MTTFTRTLSSLACCSALLASGTAQAHYLWLEPGASSVNLFYGEAEMLLKEKSPGKLDNIKGPRAQIIDTADAAGHEAPLKRTGTHFAIATTATPATVLASEESVEVKDLSKHGLGVAKSNYYARYGDAGGNPLALDVRRSSPKAFTVLYKGQPLGGAKVEVIAPNTWMQEHKTDAKGQVRINVPWRGQYVLHVLHVDKTPGEFGGRKFDNLRNHLTYTFTQQDGADPGPAVAPSHDED